MKKLNLSKDRILKLRKDLKYFFNKHLFVHFKFIGTAFLCLLLIKFQFSEAFKGKVQLVIFKTVLVNLVFKI